MQSADTVARAILRMAPRLKPDTMFTSMEGFRSPSLEASSYFLLPPSSINTIISDICTNSPRTVSSFSIHYRDMEKKYSIRGLRMRRQQRSLPGHSVVLASGQRIHESSTVGLNLFLASCLALRPMESVDVAVVPNLDPLEYERIWQRGNIGLVHALPEQFRGTEPSIRLCNIPDSYDVLSGPLKNYVMQYGVNYVSMEMNITSSGVELRYKQTHSPFISDQASPKLLDSVRSGDTNNGGKPLFSNAPTRHPTTYVIELRDRENVLTDDVYDERADDVLQAVKDFLR